jgi:hypothetical protein
MQHDYLLCFVNNAMEKLDQQIAELEKKIAHETTIKTTSENIISKYKTTAASDQAKLTLEESEKRLVFLKGELLKLKNIKRSIPEDSPETAIDEKINEHKDKQKDSFAPKSSLDYSRNGAGLSSEKITVKLAEVQYKIEVESRIKSGAEKIVELGEKMRDAVDKKTKQEAEVTCKDSKAKIALLKVSFNKYQSLNIDTIKSDDESKDFNQNEQNNLQKELVTGKLTLKLGDCQVGGKSNKGEGYAIVRVDNVVQGKSKSRSKFQFSDEFNVKLEKASEVEICVYDKVDALQAILFFRLGPLSASPEYQKGVDDEFELEPYGSLKLFVKFEKLELKKRRSKLGRRQVIRRKQCKCSPFSLFRCCSWT